MKRCRLDANVLLRFLRNDDPVQSPQAQSLLVRAQKGELHLAISVLTVAEVFYALRASYKQSRLVAAKALLELVQTGVIEVEHEQLLASALERVSAANVDFGDAMLAAEAAAAGDEVASFDRDFTRFPDIKMYAWHDPGEEAKETAAET
jgi:predicted nucleic-acid-binding protein